jgi:hypothetical protein
MPELSMEQRLAEYENILRGIGESRPEGRAFVQAVFISVTMQQNANSRTSYIKSMGEFFSIDSDKVNRITELLPQ